MNRRRKFWIDPSFQGRYLRTILLLELAVMVVTAFTTASFCFVLMNPSFKVGSGWNGIFFIFAGLALAAAGFLIRMGVRASHKICGAAYRIQTDLDKFRKGEGSGVIKLRDGDELQELAATINATVEHLKRGSNQSL